MGVLVNSRLLQSVKRGRTNISTQRVTKYFSVISIEGLANFVTSFSLSMGWTMLKTELFSIEFLNSWMFLLIWVIILTILILMNVEWCNILMKYKRTITANEFSNIFLLITWIMFYVWLMVHAKELSRMFAALESIKSFPDFDDVATFGRSINVYKRCNIFFFHSTH